MHIILNHSSMVPIYEQLVEQIKTEARRKAVEEEFEKAIDRAGNIGMSKEEILEVVKLLLEES